MSQKVKEILTFLTSKMVKTVKIVISHPFSGNFFQTENTGAQFLNRIDSLHAKHKKKTKKYVGLASYDTLRGW
jgi:hypothetical protein